MASVCKNDTESSLCWFIKYDNKPKPTHRGHNNFLIRNANYENAAANRQNWDNHIIFTGCDSLQNII